MDNDSRCTRCGEGKIKAWSDLNDEEREVVKRLPSAVGHQTVDGQPMPRWCTRCWYESVGDETLT